MPTFMSIAKGTMAQLAALMLLLMALPVSHAATVNSATANASTLTINGSGLSVGALSVTLDSVALPVVSRSDTTVTATLPTGLSSGVHPGMLTLTSRAGVQQHAFSVTISAPPTPGGSTVGALRVLDANGQFVGYYYPGNVYMSGSPMREIGFNQYTGDLARLPLYFESPDCSGAALLGIGSVGSLVAVGSMVGTGQLAIAAPDGCAFRTVKSTLDHVGSCSAPWGTMGTSSWSCTATLEPFPFVAPLRVSP